MQKKRWFLIGAAALVAAAGLAALFVIGPRNVIGMLRYDTRREGALKVGDAAPDVELLAATDGGSERVRLRERLKGRPLVLIFGSFT